MDKVVIFDLYTKKSYDDVGGKKAIAKMGVSVAGIYDYSTNNLTLYEEENVQSLIQELLSAKLIVGIHLKKFSYRVLSAFSQNEFNRLKTLDILDYLKRKLSVKPTIEGIFSGTFNINKVVRSDVYVPRLYEKGQQNEILTICKENILDLKKLFDFGRKKRYIFYNDKSGQRWKVTVDW